MQISTFVRNFQYFWPKPGGGESEAAWRISENLSILVERGFPHGNNPE